jgi:hypothetical protein
MIKQIILRLFPAKRPMLGRWCLLDKSKHLWKIDMANIDHCGTCDLTKDKKSNVDIKHNDDKSSLDR